MIRRGDIDAPPSDDNPVHHDRHRGAVARPARERRGAACRHRRGRTRRRRVPGGDRRLQRLPHRGLEPGAGRGAAGTAADRQSDRLARPLGHQLRHQPASADTAAQRGAVAALCRNDAAEAADALVQHALDERGRPEGDLRLYPQPRPRRRSRCRSTCRRANCPPPRMSRPCRRRQSR